MKKLGFFIFGIIIGFILLLINNVLAANCGGAIQCNCGDTLNESQTMWYDLNNCSRNGITISANNISFDCNGYLIDGDNTGYEYGIYLYRKDGISIKNCNVKEFYKGIYLSLSPNNTILNSTLFENSYDFDILVYNDVECNNQLINVIGSNNKAIAYYNSSSSVSDQEFSELILCNADYSNFSNINISASASKDNNRVYLSRTDYSNFFNINSSYNYDGIYLYYSSNNTLTGITANSNHLSGIYISSGSDNIILNSTLSENSLYDFNINAFSDAECNNQLINVIGSNNKAIAYYNSSSSVSDQEFSELILCNADYSNFSNINISASASKKNNGIRVHRTDHSNFFNINSSHNLYGIYFYSSSNNNLGNITANSNFFDGINLAYSTNNILTGITANSNMNGISLSSNSNNNLSNITANSNYFYGINLAYSTNNTLTGITANSNSYGLNIRSYSNNNKFTNITAKLNSQHGIYIYSSSKSILTSITANNNTDSGIFLDSSSNNNLNNIIANYNKEYGISLLGSNIILTNIIANYNRWNGISLFGSNNTLTGITANSNNMNGIYLGWGSNTLLGITANNNTNSGIYLTPNSNNNQLTNITANYNRWNGIYLDSSLNNTLLSNMFCSNNRSREIYYDIYNTNSNSGDENTCDTTYNWNDTGIKACTYSCPLPSILVTPTLKQNWNLISIPLILQNDSIEYVFGSIMDKIIVINGFDNGAKTYDPLLPEFSDLHNIDYLHGYWVKMNQSANLTINGTTPENKIINLTTNWNLISYLCNTNKSVEDIFSSIINKIIVINGFENGALTYDPLLPEFSDLTELKPNYGYWVKMNQSAVLDYNSIC